MGEPTPAPAVIGGRREPSIDPVKAEGILATVCRKNQEAARLWPERWGFYKQLRQIQEDEAVKMGFTLEEYRASVRKRNWQPEVKHYPVQVDPSPKPIPPTSSAMIGRRVTCPLERYGKLVKTGRDYPIRPPLKPGQVYDPYKQTIVFLGSVEGDPISYKLPPAAAEVTDEMWAEPRQLDVAPLCKDNLERAMQPPKYDGNDYYTCYGRSSFKGKPYRMYNA